MARSAPYSERFLFGTGQEIMTTYLVDAGRRAVLRGLALGKTQGAAAYAFVFVASFAIYYFAFPEAADGRVLDLRVVAYEGETIQAYTSGPNIVVALSGYEFDESGARAARAGDVTRERIPEAEVFEPGTAWVSQGGPPSS